MNRGQFLAVPVETRPEFRAGMPKVLFAGRYRQAQFVDSPPYDVAPDGQHFLMVLEGQDFPDPQVVYVPDWFEELKTRVPGGTGRWP